MTDLTLKPVRIAALILGGLLMIFGFVPWVVYLIITSSGFDPNVPANKVTNYGFAMLYFGVWILPWLIGVSVVVMASSQWLPRVIRAVTVLTGVMLAISVSTYLFGGYVIGSD